MSMSVAEFLWQRDQNVYIIAAVAVVAFIAWRLTRRWPLARYVLGALALNAGLLLLLGGLLESWGW